MKKFLFTVFLLLTLCPDGNIIMAQNHLYRRVEIGTENGWSFIGATVLTSLGNVLLHYPLFQSSMTFSAISSDGNLKNYMDEPEYDENGEETGSMGGYMKADGKHLFNHLALGTKIGYISDKLGWVNYGLYGAAYYNLRQLRSEDLSFNHNIQRLQIGGGVMLVLGSVEQNSRFIADAGFRYNIPVYYQNSGEWGKSDMINTGITSHYSLKYSYKNSFSIDFFCNIMHYNMFKNFDIAGEKNKIYEFGLSVAIFEDIF